MKLLNPSIPILILMLCSPLLMAQRTKNTFVDIHVNTTKKPFNSRSVGNQYNIWEPMFHACGTEAQRSKTAMNNFGAIVHKKSQSNLEAMVHGNVRLSCLNLSPVEQPFIGTNSVLTDKNKRKTISCIFGVDANQLFLRRTEINYFKDLVENIDFVKRFENKPYMINGFEYQLKLLRNAADLDDLGNQKNHIGMVFTVEGGHALGHSIYINDGITNLEEYKTLVINNIDRLKGSKPLLDGSDIYLDIPVLWISLCKSYKNGLGGTANSLGKSQQSIFSKVEVLNNKESKLGIEVIERLLSTKGGRRILVDIKHMSLDFRNRYYKTIERSEILGDAIPIVCSHCGISGLSKKNALYKKRDEDSKNNNFYLSHWQQNLCSEDIAKIYSSRGLIGISLDKKVLGGALSFAEIDATFPNTLQRRKACVKLIMANILTIVQIIRDASAWDIIALGSDFDEMAEPLSAYRTAADVPLLANDIREFLQRPESILNLFTEEDIRELMYGLSAEQITNRIMSLNAFNFIQRNLD